MATETQVQIVREDPAIEAYKLGLLERAKELSDQPIGIPVVDASGNPVMETYTDAAGVQQTRQKRELPPQQIAQMSQLQQDAISEAGAGIGAYKPYLAEAGFTLGDARAALDPSGIAQFMNPYQRAVQAEIDRSFDIQLANARQQAVGQPGGPSAFGGSRAAIQEAEIGRNRAAALAQAEAQNFLQAQQAQARQAESLGTLGVRQARLGELGQQVGQREQGFLFDLGQRQQAQQQAEIEAKRQSDMAQLYEPFQRYGFLSDIYKGAPTTQQTIASSTAPNVSPAQQFLGLGIAGLSAAAGAQKAGLFG